METNVLGKTDLVVSRMGLGMAALGRPGYINLGHGSDLGGKLDVASMEAKAFAVLDAAWQAGVRYFDVARSYGRAEIFLAAWLASRKIAPGSLTVGSKWGYTYTGGWQVRAEQHEVKDHSLATLLRQAAESKELLGPYLNLYQIHSATLESGVLENREVLEELARLRDTGLKVGLTVTGPQQAETVRRALDISIQGEQLFACVQATWNLLEQSAGTALAEAHLAGVGVIVKEGLANGRLTSRNDNLACAEKRKLLTEAASQLETSPDALALAAGLAQSWTDVVLSGAANSDHLRSNLAGQNVLWNRKTQELLASFAETSKDYWQKRALLPWN